MTRATMQQTAQRLYTIAQRADARFSATIKARTNGKRDRWTMTATDRQQPEIREAYRDKVNADEAWLSFFRWANSQSTATEGDR